MCAFSSTIVLYMKHQFGAELQDRSTKIEAQNQRQEKKISILKTERVDDNRVEMNKLMERVAHLEDSICSNVIKDEAILERLERPVPLLPLQGFFL